jgi:hypothetical protein
MSASETQSGRLGDNHGPPIQDPGPAQDFTLIGPLATFAEQVNPKAYAQFLDAIKSHGGPTVRQLALSNMQHRARADERVSHRAYRLLDQTISRCRWSAGYNFEPQDVRALCSAIGSGGNVGRIDAELEGVGYLVRIEVPRVSGGWPLTFVTVRCTPEDRTGDSTAEVIAKAKRRFNGEKRAARAGFNWSKAFGDAASTCQGDDLASRQNNDLPTGNQDFSDGKSSRQRDASRHPDAHTVITTPPEGLHQNAATAPDEGVPTESQVEAVRSLCDTFRKRPGAMVIQETQRDAIEASIRTTIRPTVEKFGAEIASQALDQTLVLARLDTRAGNGEGGAPALFRFIFEVLPDKAARLERAEKSRLDKQQSEQAVQAALTDKRMAAAKSGAARQSIRVFKR